MPRAHEASGKWGKGIVVKTYKAGQTIKVRQDVPKGHSIKLRQETNWTNLSHEHIKQVANGKRNCGQDIQSGTNYRGETRHTKGDMKAKST